MDKQEGKFVSMYKYEKQSHSGSAMSYTMEYMEREKKVTFQICNADYCAKTACLAFVST
jgi:hypothetical protein